VNLSISRGPGRIKNQTKVKSVAGDTAVAWDPRKNDTVSNVRNMQEYEETHEKGKNGKTSGASCKGKKRMAEKKQNVKE